MVILAVTALLALALALVTGSSTIAMLVVALAVIGIVALMREWRAERVVAGLATPAVSRGVEPIAEPAAVADESRADEWRADELTPDISTDPDGPTSDARAD